jgi:hypothetical protein
LLVVTGDVEKLALGPALRQIFPHGDFQTVKKDAAATDTLLPPGGTARDHFVRFVDEMLAAGDASRSPGGRPFEYVVVVDDLELANAHQADVVIEHMALAARSRLDEQISTVGVLPRGRNRQWQYLDTDADRRRYLRERCSFHPLSPMVESLFFGAPTDQGWPALRRAGTVRDAAFDPTVTDIERFITADRDYLVFPGSAGWTKGKAMDPTWRARHPKHYVSFLCDPTGRAFRPYKEKEGGKAALEALDWQSVVAPPTHACMVRALLADIADMVGTHLPWLAAGQQHPLTCRKAGGILRNIS